jgi:hypothetical protein
MISTMPETACWYVRNVPTAPMNLDVFPQVCALTAVEQQHNNNPTAMATFKLMLVVSLFWQPQTKKREKKKKKTRKNPTLRSNKPSTGTERRLLLDIARLSTLHPTDKHSDSPGKPTLRVERCRLRLWLRRL